MNQKRAGKGIICYKDEVVAAAAMVSDEDSLLLVGDKNSICIAAKDVPALSRTGIGNQMIKSGKVTTVSKV